MWCTSYLKVSRVGFGGPQTNTRGELLTLWSILFFAQYKHIKILELVGDSKIILPWFSFKNNVQVINL
jgi:hypothetical protein